MYPGRRADGRDPPDSGPRDYSQRIEKLEGYIRRLGGDPQLTEQIVENGEANVIETRDTASTSRPQENTLGSKSTEGPVGTQSRLVEHDEQVTYIETFVALWASAFP